MISGSLLLSIWLASFLVLKALEMNVITVVALSLMKVVISLNLLSKKSVSVFSIISFP